MSPLVLSIGYGLVTASLLAITAVGLSIQFGITNFANVAYCQYMTCGALSAWEIQRQLHTNLLLAGAIAGMGTGLVSMIFGRWLFGIFVKKGSSSLVLLLTSLGLMLGLSGVLSAVWGTDTRQYALGYGRSISIGPFLLQPADLWIILTSAILLMTLHLLLSYTRLGKAMRAMSDDASLARICGIPTRRITHLVWFLSGFLGASGESHLPSQSPPSTSTWA